MDDVIGGKIKVDTSGSLEISTGAKGDSGLALIMVRSANNTPSYFEFTSNSSVIPPAIKLGIRNSQGTIEYDTSTYPNGFLFKTQGALSGYPHSSFKIADDTLTFTKIDGTVVDLLAGGAASIDDSAASDTSTYSSSKIEKLTNITSSDTSITVAKSDTGVDIVANKDLVTGYAFPSDKSVKLTLGASGTEYTAPANGYFACKLYSTTAQNSLEVYSNLVAYCSSKSTTNSALIVSVPVLKGQSCTIFYVNAKLSGNGYFKFIYAQGSESEAQ